MPVAEGILPSHYVGLGYPRSAAEAGGIPVLLPAVDGFEERSAADYAAGIDGLLLAGGTDIHPGAYGGSYRAELTHDPDPARDRLELALVREARRRDLPVLGICRGFQVLNVAYGGTLDQHRPHRDLPAAPVQGLRVQVTPVTVAEGSNLARVLGYRQLDVYCLHHQAVDRVGDGLQVAARASDGMVEALEDPSASFTVGLLWHPEQMADSAGALRPYRALVAAAGRRAIAAAATGSEAVTGAAR